MIKAVIFDMDGVLIDAKQWHFDALNEALSLFGFRISQFEHHQRFDGLPTREKLSILSKENGFPSSLSSFVNEMKQSRLLEIAEQLCCTNPSHLEMMERLQSDQYRMALASNSIRRSVDVLIEKAGLSPFLDFTLSNEDVASPKPDPEIYQLAIQRLGFAPQECLVVEDGEYGAASAQAAGAHLLKVDCVDDVNYGNVRARINELDSGTLRHIA